MTPGQVNHIKAHVMTQKSRNCHEILIFRTQQRAGTILVEKPIQTGRTMDK
jgi:hypothetical protein